MSRTHPVVLTLRTMPSTPARIHKHTHTHQCVTYTHHRASHMTTAHYDSTRTGVHGHDQWRRRWTEVRAHHSHCRYRPVVEDAKRWKRQRPTLQHRHAIIIESANNVDTIAYINKPRTKPLMDGAWYENADGHVSDCPLTDTTSSSPTPYPAGDNAMITLVLQLTSARGKLGMLPSINRSNTDVLAHVELKLEPAQQPTHNSKQTISRGSKTKKQPTSQHNRRVATRL